MLAMLFFFKDTVTTDIYSLSLHDALPISPRVRFAVMMQAQRGNRSIRDCTRNTFRIRLLRWAIAFITRSEEHTSELQSQSNLVCRLLLEKKKKNEHRVERIT